MTEYVMCPGVDDMGRECGSIVQLIGFDGAKLCCKPCWEMTWAQIQASVLGEQYEADPVNYLHSRECNLRQRARIGVEVVTGRDIKMVAPEGGIPNASGSV